MEGFRRNLIFLERQSDMKIAFAPLVHTVDEGVGQFLVAIEYHSLIQFLPRVLPALLLSVF